MNMPVKERVTILEAHSHGDQRNIGKGRSAKFFGEEGELFVFVLENTSTLYTASYTINENDFGAGTIKGTLSTSGRVAIQQLAMGPLGTIRIYNTSSKGEGSQPVIKVHSSVTD